MAVPAVARYLSAPASVAPAGHLQQLLGNVLALQVGGCGELHLLTGDVSGRQGRDAQDGDGAVPQTGGQVAALRGEGRAPGPSGAAEVEGPHRLAFRRG